MLQHLAILALSEYDRGVNRLKIFKFLPFLSLLLAFLIAAVPQLTGQFNVPASLKETQGRQLSRETIFHCMLREDYLVRSVVSSGSHLL